MSLFLTAFLAFLGACHFRPIPLHMEVFIQGLLFHAAVVLEGTHFSTVLSVVSLKYAQSCSMEVVNMKFAAKAN